MTGKTRRPCRHRPLHGGFRRLGFTMVELLVVISILVLLLSLAIPAFSSMLYSSEQAMAANSLATALSAARDAALRSPVGTDAAAVFVFEPGGRVSIVPCVKAAEAWDLELQPVQKILRRDLFVPVPTLEPVQMPRNWMVRGYAPPNSMDITNTWYEDTYPAASDRSRGNWVFPETGFYDTDVPNDGEDRQTFMVRFEGGTGKLSLGNRAAALVLLPGPGTFRQTSSPFNQPGMQADREPDQARFARRVTNAPFSGAMSLSMADKFDLLGDISSDTVLAKPVQQLAVYSEPKLAAGLSIRVNGTTNSIYSSALDPLLTVPTDDVNRWIEGRLPVTGSSPPAFMPTDARVFSIQHYLGTLQELTGSRP